MVASGLWAQRGLGREEEAPQYKCSVCSGKGAGAKLLRLCAEPLHICLCDRKEQEAGEKWRNAVR